MPAFSIKNMVAAITERMHPAITYLNRLEGRPRTRSFEQSLKAEVRDALWMLTRQWQMGEFQGDDAGSPFFTRVQVQATPLTQYQSRSNPFTPMDDSAPLEARIERRPIQLTRQQQPISIDIRLLMGRQWKKLVAAEPGIAEKFLERYPIAVPPSDNADVRAHPDCAQTLDTIALRCIDGGQIYNYLRADANHHVYDGMELPEEHHAWLDDQAKKFVTWYQTLFYQPASESDSAWDASRLEYQAACSAATDQGQKQFVAKEYYQGRLDWYNFNVDPKLAQPADPLPQSITRTVVATPVQFDNMPNSRWWEFEDRSTNYGDVTASTTDVAKLLFLEFGLVYANDWFLIPLTLPSGTVANVRGLVVTNVFGEHTWINPAGSEPGDEWQRWSMFTQNMVDSVDNDVDPTLLILPTLASYQQSQPLEDVVLLRDETANIVWAIEKSVRTVDGTSRPGMEMATEVHEFWQRRLRKDVPPAVAEKDPSTVYYSVMNSVPQNWIPFIPVHIPGSNREIQLRRGVMQRVFGSDIDLDKVANSPTTAQLVFPQTSLLRKGLEGDGNNTYDVHEEEVPRSGTRLTLTFKRGRWKQGRVVTWLSITKEVGRGEGSSGLSFDQALPST